MKNQIALIIELQKYCAIEGICRVGGEPISIQQARNMIALIKSKE
jgi:hypothetical protein